MESQRVLVSVTRGATIGRATARYISLTSLTGCIITRIVSHATNAAQLTYTH